MTTTNPLTEINGEAYAAPDLAFTGHPWPDSTGGRFSLLASGKAGAVELWCQIPPPVPGVPAELVGGVETHALSPGYGEGPDDARQCWALGGRLGYCDGTCLPFDQQFAPLIRAGDSYRVLSLLAAWYHTQLDT
jgi:hypothetical protein